MNLNKMKIPPRLVADNCASSLPLTYGNYFLKVLWLCLFMMILENSSMANTGELDKGFASSGLYVNVGKPYTKMVTQYDGKLVVGGTFINSAGNKEFYLSRYNLNGSLDKSFGNGEVHTGIIGENNILFYERSKEQFMVTGYQAVSGNGSMVMALYNIDGTLDKTFNDNGKVTMSGFTAPPFNFVLNVPSTILVCSANELIQFNMNGTPDIFFGSNGRITFASDNIMTALYITLSHSILVAGKNLNSQSILNRYGSSGVPITFFGINGQVVTSYEGPVEGTTNILTDVTTNNILVGNTCKSGTGDGPMRFVLTQYQEDGKLDQSFGSHGMVYSLLGTEGGILGNSVFTIARQQDGKIVVAGGYHDFQIGRFNGDGSPDNDFNSSGAASLSIDKSNVSAGAVISGNNVFVAGTSFNTDGILASFALENTTSSTGLYYRFYSGDWKVLPDFDKIAPAKTGFRKNIDISRLSETPNYQAFVFEGYIKIDTPGDYIFETFSDDGSRFYFNTFYNDSATALVNNDGLHGARSVSGSVHVPAAGLYPIAVTYFQSFGDRVMELFWTPPGKSRERIPDGVFTPKFTEIDNAAPSAPENLRIVYMGRRFMSIDWENSIDNKGVASYRVFLNNAFSATTLKSFAKIENVPFTQINSVVVYAVDSTGNVSERSNVINVPAKSTGLTYKIFSPVRYGESGLEGGVPMKTGSTNNVDISVRPTDINQDYAFLWEGLINIPAPGIYTFETVSDDGSKVYFNTPYSSIADPLINNFENNGLHAPVSVKQTINIPSAGLYPIAITYNQYSGGQLMQLFWEGPGFTRQLVPDAAFTDDSTPGFLVNGLNYKYYEGDWSMLPDFNSLTPVQSGVSATIDINKRPATTNDHFAFKWEGYITIPTAGDYVFETISDDGSKLYFNASELQSSVATVTNDGLHPATSMQTTVHVAKPGTYPIIITFFESTGENKMEVYWSGPFITRQLIPPEAFSPNPSPSMNRLSYQVYTGTWDILPDFNALTPVKTGYSANVSLDQRPPQKNDSYGFVWQGYINIPASGSYTFETISDDGSKLYFNNFYAPGITATLNNDVVHPASSAIRILNITAAGIYPIAITYFQQYGAQLLELYWSGPGFARQRIPDEAFVLSDQLVIPTSSIVIVANETPGTQNTVTIQMEKTKGQNIYPNPFNETIAVDFYNDNLLNKISIVLYDLNGKRILLKNLENLPVGNHHMKTNLNGIAIKDGIYIIQITKNGVAWKTEKVLKITR